MPFGIHKKDEDESNEVSSEERDMRIQESVEAEARGRELTPEEREQLGKEFDSVQKMMDADNLWKKKPGAVKYDGAFIKVVEIPMFATGHAWSIVDMLASKGYTVKSVIEREYWKTSLVILEKKSLVS